MIVRSRWSCDCQRSLLRLREVTTDEPANGDLCFEMELANRRRHAFDEFTDRVYQETGWRSCGFAFDVVCDGVGGSDCAELTDAPDAIRVRVASETVVLEAIGEGSVPSMLERRVGELLAALPGAVDQRTLRCVESLLSDCGIECAIVVDDAPVVTDVAAMRKRATAACIGLQDLDLPVLVTLEILDALVDNEVRMAAKWQLAATVKHFSAGKRLS